jgi:hypothetical protein
MYYCLLLITRHPVYLLLQAMQHPFAVSRHANRRKQSGTPISQLESKKSVCCCHTHEHRYTSRTKSTSDAYQEQTIPLPQQAPKHNSPPPHPFSGNTLHPHNTPLPLFASQQQQVLMPFRQPVYPRPHPHTPAMPLHDFGYGPSPLFGWPSVMPLHHQYGQPRYYRHIKPDYRRFCYSVGNADVPYGAHRGGPLEGYPTVMAPQLLGNRW